MQPEVQPAKHRSPPKRGPRCGMNRPSALTQALDMRDLAAKLALEIGNTDANTLADKRARAQGYRDLNTVWDNCCERCRVLRQVPLPGSLKPEPKSKATRRPPQPAEPEPE